MKGKKKRCNEREEDDGEGGGGGGGWMENGWPDRGWRDTCTGRGVEMDEAGIVEVNGSWTRLPSFPPLSSARPLFSTEDEV